MNGTLGIIGCGRLGEALLGRLLGSGTVAADDVVVTARRSERVDELAERHGVDATTDNARAARCDVVVLGVKPQVLPGVLEEVGDVIADGALVVSLAAGVTTATIATAIGEGPVLVRVMTNTPALVGRAMSVLCAGPGATREHLATARSLLATLGDVRTMPESSIDAVTAVSGSGPAYVFLLAEALAEAGVLVGLTREDAVALSTATVAGSGELLAAGLGSATELREQVTSPGGTTAAALARLEAAGLRAAVLDAVRAAADRATELG